jgi:hypothetical protein
VHQHLQPEIPGLGGRYCTIHNEQILSAYRVLTVRNLCRHISQLNSLTLPGTGPTGAIMIPSEVDFETKLLGFGTFSIVRYSRS